MAQKNKAEALRDVVKETSGTALTMSPNDEGWSGYFLQKKKKIEAPSFDELCDSLIKEVIDDRTKQEVAEGKKSPKKPYKY